MAEDRYLVAAEKLARWMDDRALDPLLGLLLPGVGDVAGALTGLFTVGVAVRRRLPAIVIARMLLNLGVEALVGVVPVLGDVFDFAWKANRRNVKLLRERTERVRSWASDWALVVAALLLFVAGVIAAGLGVRWLWQVLRAAAT